MTTARRPLPGFRWLAAGLPVALFLGLVARFWHPVYGFTKFLQFDSTDVDSAVHEMRDTPVYVYPGFDGYDGFTYAEIAFHPLLDTAELKPALNNVPYRARRILGSALAWLLAGGQARYIAQVYAGLNIGLWLVLAGLAWRLLAVRDGRAWLAWAGLLFSAGALHAVRLALTDLLGVTLIAAALLLAERRHRRTAWIAAALAGLARETALSGVAGLWRGPWTSLPALARNALKLAAAALPLAAWAAYVRWKAGPAFQGVDNFTWPVTGYVGKWEEIVRGLAEPEFRWLKVTTLLSTVGLTVQAAYILHRFRINDAWWRIALTGVGMMACFGPSVWEGHPGAATRLLLPMGLAFAVLTVRHQAGRAWILAGSLTVLSGLTAFWHVPADMAELTAGRSGHAAYISRLADGWFGREQHGANQWAWSSGHARLVVRAWSDPGEPLTLALELRSLAPRTLAIHQGTRLLWQGAVGPERQRVVLPHLAPGRTELAFDSPEPGTPENGAPAARLLAFAVYNVQVQ